MNMADKTPEQIAADAKQAAADQAAKDAQATKERDERIAKEKDEQARKDQEAADTASKAPPAQADELAPASGTNANPATQAVLEQHAKTDELADKLNAANEEGHEKNLARNRTDAEMAQARTTHAEDRRANHVPTGKEDNHNTPHVDPVTGKKTWK